MAVTADNGPQQFFMQPYIFLDLIDGRPVASGCVGEVWTLLTQVLPLIPIYTMDQDSSAEIVLMGATRHHPLAMPLPFVSSWYDVHLEESLAAGATLSYVHNWSPRHWLSIFLMTSLYTLVLYAMLRCAELHYPVSVLDLPPTHVKFGSKWKPEAVPLKPRWRRLLMANRALRVRNEESLSNCVMASVAVVSNQGSWVHSHVAPIRILVVSFLVFGMIMTSAYSALLVSQLTTGRIIERAIADKEETTLCVRHDSLPYQLQLVKHTRMEVRDSCALALCEGMVALEAPEIIGMTSLPCRLLYIGKPEFVFKLAIDVMPRAPHALRGELKLQLCRLREFGLTSRSNRKWLQRPEMYKPRSNIHEISVRHVGGILFCYVLAAGFSLFILLLEISHRKFLPSSAKAIACPSRASPYSCIL